MEKSPICFSQTQNRYDAEIKNDQKVFRWTNTSECWDWDNCTVTAVKISEHETRVVIRSSHKVHSGYRKKIVVVPYPVFLQLLQTKLSDLYLRHSHVTNP